RAPRSSASRPPVRMSRSYARRRPSAGAITARYGCLVSAEIVEYDEFGLFREIADEYGLPYERPPVVRREAVEVEPGLMVSALVWGEGDARLVFLHGGAQNAHTWDTVAMALQPRPLVAIDLPGHGHSDRPGHRQIQGAAARGAATDVAVAVQEL